MASMIFGRHAIAQAQARYGIALTLLDLRRLERQIQRGEAAIVYDTRHGQRYRVTHRGVEMIAIWRPKDRKITTFLTPEDRPKLGDIFPPEFRAALASRDLGADPSSVHCARGSNHEGEDRTQDRQDGGAEDRQAQGADDPAQEVAQEAMA